MSTWSQEEHDFLFLVQAMTIASYCKGCPPPAGDDADRLMSLAGTLTLAIHAARQIPSGASVLSSALEFAVAHLPEFANSRADPSYERPKWLYVRSPSAEGIEEEVDGRWQPVNPRWKGLPGNTSVDLELMALLRERPAQSAANLANLLHINATTVYARLKKLQREGLVSKQDGKPARWLLAAAVLGMT